MSKKLEKQEEKHAKQVRRLYALIWVLACPLAYVVARLLGFEQINVVYWTLLVIPVLLGVYFVRRVPPVRQKPPLPQENGEQEETEPEEGVSPVRHAQLVVLALRLPLLLAAPILVTLIVDICLILGK